MVGARRLSEEKKDGMKTYSDADAAAWRDMKKEKKLTDGGLSKLIGVPRFTINKRITELNQKEISNGYY